MKFFNSEDFKTVSPQLRFQDWIDNVTIIANAKLEQEGKVIFCGKDGWSSNPQYAQLYTHTALLINIKEIKKCEHPATKVKKLINPIGPDFYHCECGVHVKPKTFEVTE